MNDQTSTPTPDDDESFYPEEALNYALELAGSELRPIRGIVDPRAKSSEPYDLSKVSDVVILAAAKMAQESYEQINSHIKDYSDGNSDQGEDWLKRASSARRYYRWASGILNAEIDRRKPPIDPGIKLKHYELTLANQERARQARLRSVELAHFNSQSRAGLFLRAAGSMLSNEQMQAIWDAARAMFPGHPAWGKPADREGVTDNE